MIINGNPITSVLGSSGFNQMPIDPKNFIEDAISYYALNTASQSEFDVFLSGLTDFLCELECYKHLTNADWVSNIIDDYVSLTMINTQGINPNDPAQVSAYWGSESINFASMLGSNFTPNCSSTSIGGSITSRMLGAKQYELSNHLGNVLVTVTDKKVAIDNGGTIAYYEAEISTISDYYPGGSLMTERSWSATDYKFGFNGMEKDNETYGNGNAYDFGARIYDSRLMRFMSVDPLTNLQPSYSSYLFAGNKPIAFIDKDGKMEKIVIYSKNSEGKTVMATYTKDGVTIKTEGSAALVHKDLPGTWADFNSAQFEAYKNQQNLFKGKGPESGYGDFRSEGGMLDRGTLFVNAMGDKKNVLWYESSSTPRKESNLGIIYRNVVENPDYRQKKFNSTLTNYVAGVSAPITGGLLLEFGGFATAAQSVSTVGGIASLVNTSDDFASELTGQTPIKLALGEQTGSQVKTGLAVAGFIGGGFGFKDAPLRTTATMASDALSAVSSATQCVDNEDPDIEYITPPTE